jgi:hypothetical protein
MVVLAHAGLPGAPDAVSQATSGAVDDTGVVVQARALVWPRRCRNAGAGTTTRCRRLAEAARGGGQSGARTGVGVAARVPGRPCGDHSGRTDAGTPVRAPQTWCRRRGAPQTSRTGVRRSHRRWLHRCGHCNRGAVGAAAGVRRRPEASVLWAGTGEGTTCRG